jgi:thiamine-monophosphate kinase
MVVDKLPQDVWETLLSYWQEPVAQLLVGQALSASGRRVACQDVSDGIKATLVEIGRLSGVRIVVDLDSLPIAKGVVEVAEALDVSSAALALSASTDFCLCFTCGVDDYRVIERALGSRGKDCTVIGRCEAGSGVWVTDQAGEYIEAPGVEWKHQSGALDSIILDGLRRGGR